MRLGVLRRLAQRVLELVLDVDLRKPLEERVLPAPAEGGIVSSARYVAWLAWRRLRRRDSGALAAALGLAVATAALAGVLGGVTIAADRSISQAVDRLPASVRAVRAAWFGVPAGPDEAHAVLDGEVRRGLAGLDLGDPVSLALFRESTVAGRFLGLAAVDGLAPFVTVQSGRLPATCTAERCEVLGRGQGRLPSAPASGSSKWGPRRFARANSSETFSSRPTTPRPTRRSPRRCASPGATTVPLPLRSSSPRASTS